MKPNSTHRRGRTRYSFRYEGPFFLQLFPALFTYAAIIPLIRRIWDLYERGNQNWAWVLPSLWRGRYALLVLAGLWYLTLAKIVLTDEHLLLKAGPMTLYRFPLLTIRRAWVAGNLEEERINHIVDGLRWWGIPWRGASGLHMLVIDDGRRRVAINARKPELVVEDLERRRKELQRRNHYQRK